MGPFTLALLTFGASEVFVQMQFWALQGVENPAGTPSCDNGLCHGVCDGLAALLSETKLCPWTVTLFQSWGDTSWLCILRLPEALREPHMGCAGY